MKKIYLISLILFLVIEAKAQNNVGIGTTSPSPNAILHLENGASDLGLLLPNVNHTTFNPGPGVDPGLMIYDDNNGKVYTWDGNTWVSSTSEWGVNGNDIFNLNSGQVGIGTNSPLAELSITTTSNLAFQIEGSSNLGTWLSLNSSNGGNWFHLVNTATANGEGPGKLIFFSGSGPSTASGNILTLDHASGNVGVGVTSPSHKLHVSEDIRINNILAGNGFGANPTNTRFGELSFNSLTTGGWNTAFGYISMLSSTTADANTAFGCFALTDNLTGGLNTGIGYQALRATSTGTGNTALGLDAGLANITGSNNTLIGASANVGSSALTNASAIGANAIVNSNNSLILGDPNVRVGIGTSIPLGVLHIEDADWNSNSVILNSSGTVGSSIRFQNSSVGNHVYDLIGSTGTGALTGAGFFGIYDNTAFAYRFVISPTGQIGIGTSAPSATMHVVGTGIYTGRLELTGTTDASGIPGTGVLEIANGVRIDGNEIITNTNATLFFQNDNNGDLAIDASTFYVESAGNRVGIGTTTPSTQGKLHIAGGALAIDGTSLHGISWVSGNSLLADLFRFGSVNDRLYVTNNGISNTTGVYLASGAVGWSSTSDRRLKENIVESSYGLSDILQLSPKEYNFITSENKSKRIGFIAQDVYQIIPGIVDKGDDGEYRGDGSAKLSAELGFNPWGINYTELVPVLVKAVQELNAQNEALLKRIEVLESK